MLMRKQVTNFLIAMVGVMALCGVNAVRADSWYAGFSAGNSKDNDFCDGASGVSCDDKDNGFKVFVGNQLNRNAAVEFSYIDLGEVKASGVFLGLPFDMSADGKGFGVAFVGIAPVSGTVNLFGRIGLFRWDSDLSCTTAGMDCSDSDNGVDLTFGVGVSVDVARSVALRVEWERFQDIADSDVDLLSAGV